MVNKPLIRPAISGGGTWPGGGRLTSHELMIDSLLGLQNLQCYDLGHRSTEKDAPPAIAIGLSGNRISTLGFVIADFVPFYHVISPCQEYVYVLSNHLEQINKSMPVKSYVFSSFKNLESPKICGSDTCAYVFFP